MIVEVNRKGKTHREHAPEGSTSQPCTASDLTFGRHCLNCGWSPSHVQERGAEIVIHPAWEARDLKWYDSHTSLLEKVRQWR